MKTHHSPDIAGHSDIPSIPSGKAGHAFGREFRRRVLDAGSEPFRGRGDVLGRVKVESEEVTCAVDVLELLVGVGGCPVSQRGEQGLGNLLAQEERIRKLGDGKVEFPLCSLDV